ncbi:MAG: trigger factor [bacterium]|nr:trigger factor [bacterium]
MKTTIRKLPKSRINLTIEIDKSEMEKYFDQAFDELAPSVSVKGFRPGKAPRNIITNQLGEGRIKAEAVDKALTDTYIKGLKEHDMISVGPPKIDIKSDTDGLVYSAEADVWPEAKVGDYIKLKVKKPAEEPVKEEEIDRLISYLVRQKSELKDIGRPAKNEDWVLIDFEGKVGGVVQENMVSKNHPVILGSKTLIPGFEEKLEGMKGGDEETFDITFPKDYQEKSIAGKKAEFKVKVHQVKEVIKPEVTDIFAKDFGHNSVAELRKAISESLKKEKEVQRKQLTENMVLDKLLTVAKMELPDALVEQDLDRIFHNLEHEAKNYGLTLEQYLLSMKKTQEELRKEWRGQAERNVKIGVALSEVVKREGMDSKDEKVTEKVVEKLVEYMTK